MNERESTYDLSLSGFKGAQIEKLLRVALIFKFV